MPPFPYFRNQHRRSDSTPSSDPPRSPQWKGSFPPFTSGGDDSARSPSSLRPSAISSPATESPVSPLPPVLPPIPRVASKQEKERKTHGLSKSDSGLPTDRSHVEPQGMNVNVAPLAPSPPILPQIPRIMTRRLPGQEPLKIRTTDTKQETAYHRREQPDVAPSRVEPAQMHQPEPRGSSRPQEGDRSLSTRPAYDSSFSMQASTTRPVSPPAAPSSNELHPPSNLASRRASSPTSSFSSFQKSAASSNYAAESSPGSSKPAHPSYQVVQRPTKPRMNLLNPVSLLRRRRTAQHIDKMADGKVISHYNLDVPAMSLPDDYDPRIKGKGVHDFSAPRQRRHHSTNDFDALHLQASSDHSPEEEYRRQSTIAAPLIDAEQPGAPTGNHLKQAEHDHVTMFQENFQDEADNSSNTSAVNRESLANSSFLARMSRRLDFDSPQFAYSHPDTAPGNQQRNQSPPGQRASKSTVEAPSFRASSDQSTARSSISNETRATSPPGSPPLRHQRGSLNLELPYQPDGLPKHFSSSASRASKFSFQLNSEATLAEEKALEEKGKERAAKEQEQDSDAEDKFDSSEEDDVTNYGDLDDDTYEEEIPMVNVVDEEEPKPMEWSHQQSRSINDGGFTAMSDDEHQIHETQLGGEQHVDQSRDVDQPINPWGQPSQESEGSVDSMYFDDGLIDDPFPNASGGFDESLLDSPIESDARGLSLDVFAKSNSTFDTSHTQSARRPVSGLLPSLEIAQSQSSQPGRLDEYHTALAAAAAQAEAQGRCRRQQSIDVSSSDVESDAGSKTSNASALDVGQIDWSQSNFDDAEDLDGLDDDLMVAAANAEVLASEDSEFYGQEFGFYSGALAPDAEMYSGGFFGSAPDDLKRSASGMNAGREPNLTPITERSEFSTRNSFISLHGYGSNPSAPNSAISRNELSLPSPVLGLKELAASMNMEEDDMTLSQLIKLRKETFGGSGGNAVGSSPGSVSNGSPLVMQSPPQPVPTVEEEEQEGYSKSWSSEDEDNYYEANNARESSSTAAVSLQAPTVSNSTETTPKPPPASKEQNHISTSNSVSPASSPLPTPATAFHNATYKSRASYPGQGSSSPSSSIGFTSPSSFHSTPTSPIPMPMPSPSLVQKFAGRPPASSATYHERNKQRNSTGNSSVAGSGDSVAYVKEDSKWYLERRRRSSSGELIVVGRELVEGGRI